MNSLFFMLWWLSEVDGLQTASTLLKTNVFWQNFKEILYWFSERFDLRDDCHASLSLNTESAAAGSLSSTYLTSKRFKWIRIKGATSRQPSWFCVIIIPGKSKCTYPLSSYPITATQPSALFTSRHPRFCFLLKLKLCSTLHACESGKN